MIYLWRKLERNRITSIGLLAQMESADFESMKILVGDRLKLLEAKEEFETRYVKPLPLTYAYFTCRYTALGTNTLIVDTLPLGRILHADQIARNSLRS